MSNDSSDPQLWESKRAEVAFHVRGKIFSNDSNTCRRCHDETQVTPQRKCGQSQHADALENNITCIGCHYNLAHKEVDRGTVLWKSPVVANEILMFGITQD